MLQGCVVMHVGGAVHACIKIERAFIVALSEEEEEEDYKLMFSMHKADVEHA